MSDNMRAFTGEYNPLTKEMATLRQSILSDLNRANTDIMSLVARGGPLHSRRMSANVTTLMQLARADLHVPNDTILENFQTCMNGYISGTTHHDQAT